MDDASEAGGEHAKVDAGVAAVGEIDNDDLQQKRLKNGSLNQESRNRTFLNSGTAVTVLTKRLMTLASLKLAAAYNRQVKPSSLPPTEFGAKWFHDC